MTMMSEATTSQLTDFPLQFRQLVLNTRVPIILRNFKTNWTAFDCTLQEWCHKLGTQTYDFECMRKNSSSTPQWERKRKTVQISASQFLEKHIQSENEHWSGLSYKRAHELPEECKANVDFSCFGFDLANNDYSFWLSSKGANTPCHYDTYGCNIVVQVFGRKSWLLFPPAASLKSTRIPYEESSVYCLENFYAPSIHEKESLQKLQEYAYHCILEPHDVLIVPRHWWHYVEALETSLSINAWIPLVVDVESQLEECIVKFLMESFVKHADNDTVKYLLNPNQLTQIVDDMELFGILKCLLETQEEKGVSSMQTTPNFAYQYLTEGQLELLLHEIPNACQVPRMTIDDYETIMAKNAKRFNANCTEDNQRPVSDMKEIMINSICCTAVVKCIKTEFVKRYKLKDDNLQH